MVFRELAQLFATDLAIGQMIFEEFLYVDHTVFSLSNDSSAAKSEIDTFAKIRMPRNHPAEGGENFVTGILRMAEGGENFVTGILRMAEGGENFVTGIFHMAEGGENFVTGIF